MTPTPTRREGMVINHDIIDEQYAEITRLRAALAASQAEVKKFGEASVEAWTARDQYMKSNVKLTALVTRLRVENEELRSEEIFARLEREIARLRAELDDFRHLDDAGYKEIVRLRAEIDRLNELLRGVGANRYWEGRWRDADAEIARLRTRETALVAAVEAAWAVLNSDKGPM